MKKYPKNYEDTFTSERVLNSCILDEIILPEGTSVVDYRDSFRTFLRDSYLHQWELCVKLTWLLCLFSYKTERKTKRPFANNHILDRAIGTFLKYHIGIDHKPLTSNFYFSKFVSYYKDFYPEFFERDPFKDPDYYAFPYDYISPDLLTVVYQVPDRLGLLAEAEEKKMGYSKFMDYAINHVYSYNDEVGKKVFDVLFTKTVPPYIRNNKLGKSWRWKR